MLEDSEGVLCVIVQISGPERIMILVLQLNQCTSELCEVIIYDISKLLAGEYCLFLKDADISPCFDNPGLYIPEGCVTKEISVIVKKSRRSHHLSVAGTLDVHHLSRFGTDEYDKTVRLVLLGIGGNRGRESH